MKFRTKLFYSFISLGLISSLLALFIIYGEASRLIYGEIRSKIISLVVNSEFVVNADDLETYITSKGVTASAEQTALENHLMEMRDINRRSDVYAKHIFIIKFDPETSRYEYIISPIEKGKPTSPFGSPYDVDYPIPSKIDAPFVSTQVYTGEKISYLTGYGPIRNSEGQVIAILGVDVLTIEVITQLEKLLYYGLIAFVASILVAIIFAYFLSKLVTSSLGILCDTVKAVGKGDYAARSPLYTKDEFNELSIAINSMAKGLEERERLKMGFARYVSQHALSEIINLENPISIQGERKQVTVLFSDIRNFTAIAERLPPEEVLHLLNQYFADMIEVIFSYNGTLDKFIGDGLMVEFGAPLDDAKQEFNSVLTAIHMQLHLAKLRQKWRAEGKDELYMGIGIHTGLAVVGSVGSDRRMEYTAIGDTVNVASRLEQATKSLSKPILVSKTVYEKTKDYFTFEDLHVIDLPGRVEGIQVYALDPEAQKNLENLEKSYDIRQFGTPQPD